jgi:hypothetical protein
MKLRVQIFAGLLLAAANAALAQAQPAPQVPTDSPVLVTVDNLNRAESDLVMASVVKDGGFRKYVIGSPSTSIIVYNDKGYLERNPYNAYSRTVSPQKRARTARSSSSSAAATARSPTACRPCRAGTTWCDSIVRAPKS